MTLDFVSWSVHWQLTSVFTSCIGQLWNLVRLNDVRCISMLSAKIRERRKQVTARILDVYCVRESWMCNHLQNNLILNRKKPELLCFVPKNPIMTKIKKKSSISWLQHLILLLFFQNAFLKTVVTWWKTTIHQNKMCLTV